jgi:transposase
MKREPRRALPYLPLEEVRAHMHREPRWWLIYHAQRASLPSSEITELVGVSTRTVRRVLSVYNQEGPAALDTLGSGGRHHASVDWQQESLFLATLAERAERGELTTIGEIRNAWEQQIGQRVSRSTVYRLLHRHGWRKLTPRPRHPKANTAEQAAWLRAFPDQVQAALSTRDPTDQRPVRKMAQDESRFGHISRPRRAWAPPGMRPRTARQHVRESTYVYAAVAPEQGEVISLILPEVSTAMMQLFLDHVSASYADSFLVMQLDQAAWHQIKELRVPENIRLITQPAYSPELNPTEKLWEEPREK